MEGWIVGGSVGEVRPVGLRRQLEVVLGDEGKTDPGRRRRRGNPRRALWMRMPWSWNLHASGWVRMLHNLVRVSTMSEKASDTGQADVTYLAEYGPHLQ